MRFAYKSYEIPKSPLDGSIEIFRPEILVRVATSTHWVSSIAARIAL